jgi:hypothetical protein
VVHVDAAALAGDDDGACQLEHGTALHPETARRLGCDASLVRIVERDGRPLSVGRRTRSVSPALRRALKSRDPICRFPGCDRRRFLHAHHLDHWASGGRTDLSNLVRLCSHHHRLVHEGGYRIERSSGWAALPPPRRPAAAGRAAAPQRRRPAAAARQPRPRPRAHRRDRRAADLSQQARPALGRRGARRRRRPPARHTTHEPETLGPHSPPRRQNARSPAARSRRTPITGSPTAALGPPRVVSELPHGCGRGACRRRR